MFDLDLEVISHNSVFLRSLTGISMDALAEEIGISRSKLARLERGETLYSRTEALAFLYVLEHTISDDKRAEFGKLLWTKRKISSEMTFRGVQFDVPSRRRFVKNMRRLRACLGLSVTDIAKASGISISHYCNIETGSRGISECTYLKLLDGFESLCETEESVEMIRNATLQRLDGPEVPKYMHVANEYDISQKNHTV